MNKSKDIKERQNEQKQEIKERLNKQEQEILVQERLDEQEQDIKERKNEQKQEIKEILNEQEQEIKERLQVNAQEMMICLIYIFNKEKVFIIEKVKNLPTLLQGRIILHPEHGTVAPVFCTERIQE
jgi:HSP90 family molecular chaperone